MFWKFKNERLLADFEKHENFLILIFQSSRTGFCPETSGRKVEMMNLPEGLEFI